MRITEKGQVTIPKEIRENFGFYPGQEVRFVKRDRGVVLEKIQPVDVWEKYSGFLKIGKKTDEVIRELRGPRP